MQRKRNYGRNGTCNGVRLRNSDLRMLTYVLSHCRQQSKGRYAVSYSQAIRAAIRFACSQNKRFAAELSRREVFYLQEKGV